MLLRFNGKYIVSKRNVLSSILECSATVPLGRTRLGGKALVEVCEGAAGDEHVADHQTDS